MSGAQTLKRRSFKQRFFDRLEMVLARLVQGISRISSNDRWAFGPARAIGPWLPGMQTRVAENLALVRPGASREEVRALTAGVSAHFACAAVEYVNLDRIAADRDRVVIEDAAPLLAALEAGRGAILASAHFGNWEAIRLAVRYATAEAGMGRDCALVRRHFNNPRFDALSQTMIANAGTPVLHKGREGTRGLVRHVARQGVALILADQRQTGAPLIPFLGRGAETSLAAAELALRFNCALIPARCLRLEDGRFSVLFEAEIPPSDPETMMAQVNARIGAWVDACPEQWFWLHRRWKTRPRGERMRAARVKPD